MAVSTNVLARAFGTENSVAVMDKQPRNRVAVRASRYMFFIGKDSGIPQILMQRMSRYWWRRYFGPANLFPLTM